MYSQMEFLIYKIFNRIGKSRKSRIRTDTSNFSDNKEIEQSKMSLSNAALTKICRNCNGREQSSICENALQLYATLMSTRKN